MHGYRWLQQYFMTITQLMEDSLIPSELLWTCMKSVVII